MVIVKIVGFILLASCSPKVSDIKAPRSYLAEGTRPLLLSGLENRKMDSEIRSISFVIYPTQEDLKGFEYAPNEEMAALWDSVASYLPYGDRLKRSYRREESEDVKLSKMVTTIVSVSDFRTNTFRAMVPLQQEAEQMATSIRRENSSLKEELRELSCFYMEEAEDGTYQCQWERTDNGLQEKSLGSCRSLEKHHFSQDSSAQSIVLEELTRECQGLAVQRKERSGILEQINVQSELREQSGWLLLDLLLAAEKHSKEKVFLALGASKERKSEGESISSTLTMGPTASSFEELRLLLDFGSNYSDGAGFQEYSTNNGKITELRLNKKGWADVLEFTIHTSDFRVEASLSMTVQDYVDWRFVGDIRVIYPDGSVGGGLMALELDRQR